MLRINLYVRVQAVLQQLPSAQLPGLTLGDAEVNTKHKGQSRPIKSVKQSFILSHVATQ